MKNILTEKEAQKVMKYWTDGSREDFKTAETLLKNKIYHYCLFFCHLSLEKLIKALVVKKTRSHALPIHNLIKLISDANLKINDQQRNNLSLINEFNIRARYNDYKRQFYKKATEKYATNWFKKCEEFFLWLEKELKRK